MPRSRSRCNIFKISLNKSFFLNFRSKSGSRSRSSSSSSSDSDKEEKGDVIFSPFQDVSDDLLNNKFANSEDAIAETINNCLTD